MLKSTAVKWAVAALLTVPAVPLMARTTRHKLTSHARTHLMLAASHARAHHLVHRSVKTSASKTRAHHLTSARRHAVHTASVNSGYRLKITRMPPTIDNIGA
jgi:hypothetical protein